MHLNLLRTCDTFFDPHPAAQAINPKVNNMEANDCKDPHTVNTEQQMQRRQQIVSSAKRSKIYLNVQLNPN